MAFLVAKLQFSLTLLLVLISSLFLSSSHARDSQYFSKVSASNQQVEKIEEQESDGNPHGLYGAHAAPPPPTTARPSEPLKRTPPSEPTSSSWRPDNYNPVAYVTAQAKEEYPPLTGSEETHDSYTTTGNNGYDAVEEKYRNSQQQGNEEEYFNSNNVEEEDGPFPTFHQLESPHHDDTVGAVSFQKQGMSDTRYLEHGKYFYDVKNQVYSQNHPYEVLKATNRNAQTLSSYNNYEARSNAFTGYRSPSYNSENSMEMNNQIFEQDDDDDSDMP